MNTADRHRRDRVPDRGSPRGGLSDSCEPGAIAPRLDDIHDPHGGGFDERSSGKTPLSFDPKQQWELLDERELPNKWALTDRQEPTLTPGFSAAVHH